MTPGTQKKAAKPVQGQEAQAMDPKRWAEMLDQVEKSGGDRTFFIPKKGKTKLRLVVEEGRDPYSFYAETRKFFNGQTRTRFIVMALIHKDGGIDYEARPVVLAKSTIKDILTLLADGYDLLTPEEGRGLTISKSGEQLDTSYTVMPSQREQPIDYDKITWPEMSLDELAEKFEADSQEYDENKRVNPAAKGGKVRGGGSASLADDIDEDDIPF